MKQHLIFATHNTNKSREIAALLGGNIEILTLNEIGFKEEIEETGTTLQSNAYLKAHAIFKASSRNCFADDSGLLVAALNGAPGVYSARYGGEEKDAAKNNEKLLGEMMGVKDRTAYFETVICLFYQGSPLYFTGKLEGTIALEPIGDNGFGYDPLFIPSGSNKTLAQINLEGKNKISHRAKAFNQMADFFKRLED